MDPEAQRWFRITCGFELALLALAALIASLTQRPLFADLHWDLKDALWGISASAPPLAVFVHGLQSVWKPFAEIRSALDRTVGCLFAKFSVPQLFVVSALAGISEEALFRAVAQGSLQAALGSPSALLVASVAFGCAHLLNWSYGGFAVLAGLYLGSLWLATGNLLTPIITHGLYDFLALVYYLKISRGDAGRR
ncbi:MAG: CPBP family intramembrane metalloprotease [Verrucomicrobiales bacterium]|nr:CPBP family intramembrane metalloprotease [Verrucomicrobiales bacterium]